MPTSPGKQGCSGHVLQWPTFISVKTTDLTLTTSTVNPIIVEHLQRMLGPAPSSATAPMSPKCPDPVASWNAMDAFRPSVRFRLVKACLDPMLAISDIADKMSELAIAKGSGPAQLHRSQRNK